MGTHEVVGKAFYRSSSHDDDDETEAGMPRMQVFEVGDEIEPTESELEAFPDRFREIRASTEGTIEPPLNLTDMTVGEVQEALETGDYDDKLAILEEAETQNDDRKGVLEAIDERR